jgi:hypothetical protein
VKPLDPNPCLAAQTCPDPLASSSVNHPRHPRNRSQNLQITLSGDCAPPRPALHSPQQREDGRMAQAWKKGRGKLGPMAPLIGRWKAEADTPMGPVKCIRDYQKFGDSYVRLEAEWNFGGKSKDARVYREVCMFGPDKDGLLTFWSYTNDGKKSSGALADGTDMHPQAVCFEAQMDAGLARQVFWPDDKEGMRWVVEAKTKKGWSQLAAHHYRPA